MGLLGDIANVGLGLANQQWMRQAQKNTWEREDNAVQRRVADLQKAGLNPVLAAGSAAQSSSPINTQAPQWGGTAGDKAQLVQGLIQGKKNIAVSEGQAKLLEEQRINTGKQSQYYESQMVKAAADTAKAIAEKSAIEQDRAERLYNWSKAQELGMRSDIKGGIAAEAQQFGQTVKKAVDSIAGPLGSAAASVGTKITGPIKKVHSGLAGAIDRAIDQVKGRGDKSAAHSEALPYYAPTKKVKED